MEAAAVEAKDHCVIPSRIAPTSGYTVKSKAIYYWSWSRDSLCHLHRRMCFRYSPQAPFATLHCLYAISWHNGEGGQTVYCAWLVCPHSCPSLTADCGSS